MRKISIFAVGCLIAAGALAQPTSPLKQSGGPTSNEARIRIVEPAEGAVLSGSDFNMVIQDQQFPSGTSVSSEQQKDLTRPVYQLFVDKKDLGNISMDRNVIAVHTDGFGAHKIVLLAKNGAGQVIDRKELNVTTQEGSATASTSTSGSSQSGMSGSTAGTGSASTAPSSGSTSMNSTDNASTPSSSSGTGSMSTSSSGSLPKTASSFPAAALAGLALMGTGVLIRRRRV